MLNQCAVYSDDSNAVQCEICNCFYDVSNDVSFLFIWSSREYTSDHYVFIHDPLFIFINVYFCPLKHLVGKKLCSSCLKKKDKVSTLERVGNSCEDTMKFNKPGFPLITFSRRSRHKKTLDGNGMQEKSSVVEKYGLVAVKESNSTMDNGCLLDLSADLTRNDPNASPEKVCILFI